MAPGSFCIRTTFFLKFRKTLASHVEMTLASGQVCQRVNCTCSHFKRYGVNYAKEFDGNTPHIKQSLLCAKCFLAFASGDWSYTKQGNHKTQHIQERSYTRHVIYQTCHIQDSSYTRQVIYKTGHIENRSYTRHNIYTKSHIQDRSYTRQIIYKTGHIQDRSYTMCWCHRRHLRISRHVVLNVCYPNWLAVRGELAHLELSKDPKKPYQCKCNNKAMSAGSVRSHFLNAKAHSADKKYFSGIGVCISMHFEL